MTQRDKIAYNLSCCVLVAYVVIALSASFIAGEDPVICISDRNISMPVLQSTPKRTNYHSANCIFPPIPFSSQSIDPQYKSAISPFATIQSGKWRYRHWLGTDKLGRDVASGMIHGTAIAIKIGFIAVFFSFLVGVSLGLVAGYYQDSGLTMNLIQLLVSILMASIGIYYIWYEFLVFNNNSKLALFWASLLFCTISVVNIFIGRYVSIKRRSIPIDLLIVKLIEIRKSFPGIFLLLALVSIFSVPSVWNIVFVITLLSWADFARLARGETIALKNENYIKSAKILGFSSLKIIYRHILPNIMPTLIVAVCFSITSAILLESTLSFLGVGLPVEEVSWGKMMAEGRNLMFWWLVVFPGIAIFILVLSLNTIASKWQKSNFTLFTTT